MKSIVSSAMAGMLAVAAISSGAALAQDTASPPITVTGKYISQWERAKAAEQKALDVLRKAQEKLAKANADILKQNDSRAANAEQARQAEERFRGLIANIPTFSTGKDAKSWASSVENAASDWADATGDQNKDQKDLRQAMKDQTAYQKAVDKAQAAVEKARKAMAEAERRSQQAAGGN